MLSGIRNPMVINGVPVIVAPAEIDLTTAEQLRMVLFDSAGRGHATIRPLVHQPGPGHRGTVHSASFRDRPPADRMQFAAGRQ